MPVILLDLPVEDARLLNVALNQIGGEWDADLLARLLIDLRATADRDLTLSGFAEADLADLLTRFDQREKRARPERFDLEEALAEYDREASGIAPGAGWQLGAHRLFRGDATDAAFLARCLGDGPAALVVTEPALQRGLRRPRWPGARRARPASDQRRHARRGVGALLPGLGGGPDGQRGRRPIRLHELQGVAPGRPGAGRGRGALVGHDHLGQGPLHAGPGRLSAPVRADLVRLAGGAPAALGRRARSGRCLVHPASRRLAAAPHPEAAGTGRARDRELQHPRRHGPGPLLRRRHDADRLRTYGALRGRDRARPPLRGGDDRALGGVHGRGRRAACQALKGNGRPCRAPALRAGSACFWHAAESREDAAEARRLGGLRRRREGTVGGAYGLEGFRTGADLQRVLELALADTLELENTVPRTRALTQLVAVAARVKETTELEARLRALEDGVWRETPDAGS